MRVLIGFLFSLFLAGQALAGPIDKLTFYTENFPPYQFREDGRLKGIFIDILKEAFKRAGTTKTIEGIRMMPWARGYTIVQNTPNTVLFGTARTKKREKKFLWVGPGTASNHVVLGRKSEGHDIQSLDQLNQHLTVTIRDDVAEQLLLDGGVHKENLIRQASLDSIIRVLKIKRADFWAYNIDVAYYALGRYGLARDYEVVYTLRQGGNWLALNLKSDPAAVKALQEAIDAVRTSQTYLDIIARYR